MNSPSAEWDGLTMDLWKGQTYTFSWIVLEPPTVQCCFWKLAPPPTLTVTFIHWWAVALRLWAAEGALTLEGWLQASLQSELPLPIMTAASKLDIHLCWEWRKSRTRHQGKDRIPENNREMISFSPHEWWRCKEMKEPFWNIMRFCWSTDAQGSHSPHPRINSNHMK